MLNQPTFTNKLIQSSSPYLLQHAHNPVDWYEWGDEAFEKARNEDKLILISIGYSACHWCHVMAHECFENEETATIMNSHFVCIKIDREERPDIDQIYMDAVQLLTGSGGWPLNCFALPDGRPLHGGTYFPKIKWEQLLLSIHTFYKTRRADALTFATDLTSGVQKMNYLPTEADTKLISKDFVNDIFQQWKQHFDLKWGGYNWSPKFPMPNNWECFLQYGTLSQDQDYINATHLTLLKMAEGGIFDQLGGGFARYSTDTFWLAPHFEKMLYDNAQLMGLYARAYQQNKNKFYQQIIEKTHAFLKQEMTNAEGLFYSALDADSEGVEGKYYVWTKQELEAVLGESEPLFSLYYSVTDEGNWEHGYNILHKTLSNIALEMECGKPIADIELIIEGCRQILLEVRDMRIAPSLDNKCITSWNALMIKGYAEAYEVFGVEAYLEAADCAANILLQNMWDGTTLFRIYKDGKVSIPGFAEDYATLIDALIVLFEAGGSPTYLTSAKQLMQSAMLQFFDVEFKLFYFKSNNDEQLISRKIDTRDDVIPSANSVFAKVLLKLGYYFDKPQYHQIVDDMLNKVQPKIAKPISSHTNWIQVILWRQYGFKQVIVCGKNAILIKRQLQQYYLPNTIVLIMNDERKTIPLFAGKNNVDEILIYVCIDKVCMLPTKTVSEALMLIQAN